MKSWVFLANCSTSSLKCTLVPSGDNTATEWLDTHTNHKLNYNWLAKAPIWTYMGPSLPKHSGSPDSVVPMKVIVLDILQ